jgi:hypothetical protein
VVVDNKKYTIEYSKVNPVKDDFGGRTLRRYKSWILTDVADDVWLDTFAVGSDPMPLSPGQDWSIRKRTLHGGLRDGIDLIEVDNGALSYQVLPTRGMGLWRGRYHGLALGWAAPVQGPVHPKFVNVCAKGGAGWLAGFDEWVCRCGLSCNGPPGDDVHTDRHGQPRRDQITLHGRIANLPAHYVEARVGLDPPFEISVVGVVEEAGLFHPHLRLTTTMTTVPGSARLMVHDVVENRGAQPAEMMLLYHVNLGPPFLESGSRVALPFREVSPISPRAAAGIDTLDTFAGPTTGFAEQVYLYDLLADNTGRTLTMLYNHAADRAVVLRYSRRELPCFTVWRNTMAVEEGYVAGLEPGTNFPNFKSFERQQGRVPTLAPGGKWETMWSIEVCDSSAGVAGVLGEIASLQSQERAVVHQTPQARFSAAGG